MRRCPLLVCEADCLGDCAACREDLAERSALIEFGGAASTRAEADALALAQLRERATRQRQGVLAV